LSAREPVDRDVPDRHDESFLSRWSRRKAEARAVEPPASDPVAVDPAPSAAASAPVAEPPAEGPAAQVPTGHAAGPRMAAAPAPAIELPDLDRLGEDSDYSAFLTPGVDADLRRRALRKLFSSPKFNVFDGLDTYRDDYTSFPALGSVVTADMRYHVERLAKKVVEVLDEQTAPAAPVEPVAPAAAIVSTGAEGSADTAGVAATEGPAAEPPAPAPEENHDRIA
jgi:hypothetical protein